MITLILYLLKVIVVSGMLYVCFRMVLADRLYAGPARVYLLLSLMLPAALPFVKVHLPYNGPLPLLGRQTLQEIIIRNTPGVQHPNSGNLFLAGYLLVSVTLLLISLAQYIRFYCFLRQHHFQYYNKHRVYLNTGRGPGSFFNMIFLKNEEAAEAVMEHESAHIVQHHWADLLFARIIQCAFWPNFFIILIARELKLVHEYEADRYAINSSGLRPAIYAGLLLDSHLNSRQYSIAHSFIHHPLKRRITMLQKKTKRFGTIVHFSLAIAIMCSCATVSVLAQDSHKKAGHQGNSRKKIYEQVEEQPKFHGDLGSYLQNNLRYPEKARAANKQGKSYINFVVNENGSVSDVAIKRSSGNKYLDAEAIRAVSSMPPWDPGKVKGQTVACYFTIPIAFMLDN